GACKTAFQRRGLACPCHAGISSSALELWRLSVRFGCGYEFRITRHRLFAADSDLSITQLCPVTALDFAVASVRAALPGNGRRHRGRPSPGRHGAAEARL